MNQEIALFAANDDGAAALEYSLIAAGIALAFLAAFLPFGGELRVLADTITAGVANILALSSR